MGCKCKRNRVRKKLDLLLDFCLLKEDELSNLVFSEVNVVEWIFYNF